MQCKEQCFFRRTSVWTPLPGSAGQPRKRSLDEGSWLRSWSCISSQEKTSRNCKLTNVKNSSRIENSRQGEGTMANCFQFASIFILLAVCNSQKSSTIPSYIRVCKQSDPKVEHCMIDSIERLRPYLVRGIPEFKVPPIEPLNIKSINANQGSGFKITLTDVKAYGCSDFTINRLKLDMRTNTIDFGLNLPNLYIESNYEVDGRVFLLPIRGRGPMRGNFTNCKGDVILRGALENRGGKDYLKYKSMDIKIQVGKGRLNLQNLFGGDRTLGTVVNDAINANFDQLMKELKPQIERAIANFMLDTANQVVQNFPYAELFPK